MASQHQENPPTIPLKIQVYKQANKVVAIEATRDFVDTLFSFLSLPLGTIIRLVKSTNDPEEEEEPFLGCIPNLYQSAHSLTSDDVWNTVCKAMLLRPRNPCESLCSNLLFNVDDTDPTPKVLVCPSCNTFSTFTNLDCLCGKPITGTPHDLDKMGNSNGDLGGTKGGVFVKDNGSLFMVFDDLTVVPSSLVTSMDLLLQRGYWDLTQLEELTHSFGKKEMLNLLKYIITSHEPLSNAILASNSKKKRDHIHPFAPATRVTVATNNAGKMDVKVMRSKSQNKIIFAEAKEDFVDFIFSFLTMPLGSIVRLLGGRSSIGCVDNLYMSLEILDPSCRTDSHSALLDPGLAPQFGCPNQPLSIREVHPQPRHYFYGAGTLEVDHCFGSSNIVVKARGGGVISSKSPGSIANVRHLTALDPRSPERLEASAVGFVKRPALYGVGDDLRVRALSATSCLSYLKEMKLPLDDLQVEVISISEAEALSLLGASLTSNTALTSGLQNFLDVPKQEEYNQLGDPSTCKLVSLMIV